MARHRRYGRMDLGHRKEKLVEKLINKMGNARRPWLIEARQTAPGKKEDGEGKDIIIYTTHGEFYLQIKSCLKKATDFIRDKIYSKQYKTMHLVASPDATQTTRHEMTSPNQNAYAFIVVLVIFSKKEKKTAEIEDTKAVLKKIQIALDIISRHIDELNQKEQEKK